MAMEAKAMLKAGAIAGKQGFELVTDGLAVGSDLVGGVRSFVQDLVKEPSEEEKKIDQENEKRELLLMQATEMQRQKRILERLGYKSYAELQKALDEFYGKTNDSKPDNQ